jgi:saccharopine dehydrogenase-like NADP-dependent oxidoreductase
MIRGTLRWPGWSETWAQIVRLGLPNETLRIPDLAERTYREVLEMFLPLNIEDPRVEQRLARYLRISPTGEIMQKLQWLGLLSDEKTGCRGETAAAMLVDLLKKKLPLSDDARDMVVLVHEMDVAYPGSDRAAERITSTLVAHGDPGGFTAMSRTVGLPVAIAAKLLLRGELPLTGSHLPTHPSIYGPVLEEMAREGLEFAERTEPVPDAE